MVLVVTNRLDLTADWLILELERRGSAYVRFNTEDYPAQTRLTWEPSAPARLAIGGNELTLEQPLSIWYRRPAPPARADDLPGDAAEWAAGEAAAALMGVWRTQDALWVNHPDANALAGSKPEQLRTAARLGLRTPRSVITNVPQRVRELADDVGGRVVCKPLSRGDISIDGAPGSFFTSELPNLDAALDGLGTEPYLFQELVEKRYDIRVTVIGDEVFAVRIESQHDSRASVDWRRAEAGRLEHSEEELPDDVAVACLELVRHYGLRFGAIDLAREPSGDYRFFELNPNGQWAWIEQTTGLPLRACLADLLLEADAGVA